MAKKQSLSYGPNMGLIAGEAQVAKSEAGLSNSVGAFAQGFMGVFGAFEKANQERDARMEAYEAGLPGVTNINLIQDPANKQIITGFLNEQRDEFNRLAQIFDKTKDRNVKDQMEAVKFSLINLNDQIKVFDQDKMDYRTASDENQLASLRTYDKDGNDFFTNTYTNNARMQISKNGDLGFTVNNKFYNYKDKAGRWNINANEEQAFILKGFSTGIGNGAKGIKMNPDHVFTNMFAGLKRSTASDLQVLATTDLVGDNRSETFEKQFANGDPKFKSIYDKIGIIAGENKKYDTEWMFDNKNSDKLKIALAEYFKNVVVDGNTTAYENYSNKINDKTGTGKEYKNYTVDGYTGVNYPTAKAQYDNMLVPGKINYDRKGDYKYISDGKGNTDVYIQKTTGKYEKVETIPTNDALARRGLDLFGEGYITPKTDIKFINFNNDRDGDGIPNNIDREPDNPNN